MLSLLSSSHKAGQQVLMGPTSGRAKHFYQRTATHSGGTERKRQQSPASPFRSAVCNCDFHFQHHYYCLYSRVSLGSSGHGLFIAFNHLHTHTLYMHIFRLVTAREASVQLPASTMAPFYLSSCVSRASVEE